MTKVSAILSGHILINANADVGARSERDVGEVDVSKPVWFPKKAE